MDDGRNSISPNALYARLGSESAPIIIDARRDAGFPDSDTSRHDLSPQAAACSRSPSARAVGPA
jgi:hypothetical protein